MAAPTVTWPALPTATTSNELDDNKQHNCADQSVDDRADNSPAEVDTELRQQPVADECADNSDYQVTNEPKADPVHNSPSQISGDETDHQYDQETFVRQVHDVHPGLELFFIAAARAVSNNPTASTIAHSPCKKSKPSTTSVDSFHTHSSPIHPAAGEALIE